MKKDIHPKLHMDCKVTCACGNTFETISTLPEISIGICSMCHPLFTGEMKFVDTEGRIEQFTKKLEKSKKVKASREKKGTKKKAATSQQTRPKSLKDLLQETK